VVTIRYLVISDIHGNVRNLQSLIENELQNSDALLVAGDLSSYSGSFVNVLNMLSIVASRGKKVIVVIGNMDSPNLINYICKNYPNITCLHGSITELNSLVIAGLSGGLYSPFNTPFELSDEDFEKLITNIIEELNNIEDIEFKTLILLTHTPPYGTKVDLTFTGLHVGSKSIRRFIEEFKPVVVISGHIHEARGIDRLNNTLIINPGPLFRGYYALLSINGKDVKVYLKELRGSR